MSTSVAPVIQVSHLVKKFRLRQESRLSLKHALLDGLRGGFLKAASVLPWRTVLSDLSFEIYPGEFVGIMGRNGVGKSTLFRILSGIYQPTSGVVKTVGRVVPLIELGAGFHPDLSGLENIYLNAAILGIGRSEIQKEVDSIIDWSELKEFLHQPVRNYSSGMLARLSFSVAVHLKAQIFLVDEILAVGDLGFQKKCLEKIRFLHQQGATFVLITHDPGVIAAECSRCLVIQAGKLIWDGDPRRGTQAYRQLFQGE